VRYEHILAAVTEERWAIERSKLQIMVDLLADQAAGIKYDAETKAARIGPNQRGRDGQRQQQQGDVAILPLRGVISNRMNMLGDISGGTSSEAFGAQFDTLVNNDQIKAIVIDVDSPGGAVSGTAELSSKIFAARGRKPIVAHVNATAASAAYWIATAADEIVVTPSGSVGSIGVLAIHDDISGALDKAGVRKTIISAGELKTSGNPFEPLGDEARARMQSRIDQAYDMFVTDVARNRGVPVSAVRGGFGRGDIVDARRAVNEGMADRIGTLDETITRLTAGGFATKSRSPARDQRANALAREERFSALKWAMIPDDEILELRGLAAPFDQIGYPGRPTLFRAGCFRLTDRPFLLRDHDSKRKLAKPTSVQLSVSDEGAGKWLAFNCALMPNAYGLLAIEAIMAGINSVSVGFSPERQHTRSIGRQLVNVVESAGLPEISLVSEGAFAGTVARLVSLVPLPLSEAVTLFRTRVEARKAAARSG
jgi:signal peptide peptidase SppA